MTWIALAALGLTSLVALLSASTIRWQARAHTRVAQTWEAERGRLIEAMAHLAGRPLPSTPPWPSLGTTAEPPDYRMTAPGPYELTEVQ